MQTICITYNHNFKSVSNPRIDKLPTVFDRVLRYLREEGKPPGDIKFLFLNDSGNFRVIGAFTINVGGSISFFPDFNNVLKAIYRISGRDNSIQSNNFEPFDHYTYIPKKNTGHMTKIVNGGREHLIEHNMALLENGSRTWLTIIVSDSSWFNDMPNEPIRFKDIEAKETVVPYFMRFLDASLSGGSTILKFPKEIKRNMFGAIQIQLYPKDIIDKPPFKIFAPPIYALECSKAIIPAETKTIEFNIDTKQSSKFNLSIGCFNLEGKPVDPLLIVCNKSVN